MVRKMFFKSIKTQTRINFDRVSVYISMMIISVYILLNYYCNIQIYKGYDISQMIHPMKLLMLESHNKWGFYFMQLLPFILVIPAAFSYINDLNNHTSTLLIAKFGRKSYYYGKFVSVCLTTFLAFIIPLMLEFFITIAAFPHAAAGDLSNSIPYDEGYIQATNNYFAYEFWKSDPYVYTVVCLFLFSFVMSVFSGFLVSLSMLNIFKFRILLFLPAYLMLYLLRLAGNMAGINLKYTDNLYLFDTSERLGGLFYVIVLIILLVSLLMVRCKVNELY